MKRRFLLLAILSSLALSGCDALDSFFGEKTPSENENKEGVFTPSQEGEISNEENPTVDGDNGTTENPPIEEDPGTEIDPPTGGDPATPVIDDPAVKEYYKNINTSKTGSALKTELYNLIKNHTKYDYDTLEIAMRTTDRNWEKSPDPNDENPYMNLLYTVNNNDKASKWNTYHGGGGILDFNTAHWNKEHIWAKSNGFNSKGAAAYSDLHHLRASDTKNNNTRDKYAFNNNSGSYVKDFNGDNSGKLGGSPTAYEPIARDKGDVARALFYMATRYSTGDGSTGTNLTLTTGTDSTGGKFGFLNTLLEWNELDPPDAWEINRNGLVQSIQNNRNPYIDHPEWARKVFG